MKLIKEYINEKFTDESDPVHDLGIGVKAYIEYCLTLLKKLDGKRKKAFVQGYIYYTGINNKLGLQIKVNKSNSTVNIIQYFTKLLYEAGLHVFLDINDEIINDEFRESKFMHTYNIIWVIKDKYVKYFKEISNEYINK